MIRRVRIDYQKKKPPGVAVIVATGRGKIVYERGKTRRKKRA